MFYTRAAQSHDAQLIYQLYMASPHYFDLIGTPMPTETEVQKEVELTARDSRRNIAVIYHHHQAVGLLDYTFDYPETGDATINLLLITEHNQHKGFGRMAVEHLEKCLRDKAKRILASVYGYNPLAVQFWESMGYSLAINAKPVMEWYAKPLHHAA